MRADDDDDFENRLASLKGKSNVDPKSGEKQKAGVPTPAVYICACRSGHFGHLEVV